MIFNKQPCLSSASFAHRKHWQSRNGFSSPPVLLSLCCLAYLSFCLFCGPGVFDHIDICHNSQLMKIWFLFMLVRLEWCSKYKCWRDPAQSAENWLAIEFCKISMELYLAPVIHLQATETLHYLEQIKAKLQFTGTDNWCFNQIVYKNIKSW